MRHLDKGEVQLVYQHLLPKLVRPSPTFSLPTRSHVLRYHAGVQPQDLCAAVMFCHSYLSVLHYATFPQESADNQDTLWFQ